MLNSLHSTGLGLFILCLYPQDSLVVKILIYPVVHISIWDKDFHKQTNKDENTKTHTIRKRFLDGVKPVKHAHLFLHLQLYISHW